MLRAVACRVMQANKSRLSHLHVCDRQWDDVTATAVAAANLASAVTTNLGKSALTLS